MTSKPLERVSQLRHIWLTQHPGVVSGVHLSDSQAYVYLSRAGIAAIMMRQHSEG